MPAGGCRPRREDAAPPSTRLHVTLTPPVLFKFASSIPLDPLPTQNLTPSPPCQPAPRIRVWPLPPVASGSAAGAGRRPAALCAPAPACLDTGAPSMPPATTAYGRPPSGPAPPCVSRRARAGVPNKRRGLRERERAPLPSPSRWGLWVPRLSFLTFLCQTLPSALFPAAADKHPHFRLANQRSEHATQPHRQTRSLRHGQHLGGRWRRLALRRSVRRDVKRRSVRWHVPAWLWGRLQLNLRPRPVAAGQWILHRPP
jgi:hypothetical protein